MRVELYPQAGNMRRVGFSLVVLLAGTVIAWAEPVVQRVSMTARADGQGYVVRFHMSETVQAYRQPHVGEQGVEIILFNAALAQGFIQDEPAGPVVGIE